VFELALHLSIFEAQLKLNQAVMHLLQGLDLPHQFLLFVIDGLHGQIPGQLLAAMILQNGLHFLELETELLSAFDEGQQLYALLAVDAVLAFALRGGQQADFFVMSNAFDGGARQLGSFADVHENPFL